MKSLLATLSLLAVVLAGATTHVQDPLASWNDTAPKKSTVAFGEKVTKQGSADFIPPSDRIATFDNDGTLWAEQPFYVQLAFAVGRVKVLAPQHPEWKTGSLAPTRPRHRDSGAWLVRTENSSMLHGE